MLKAEGILSLIFCPVTSEPYSGSDDAQAVALVARGALDSRVCGHTVSQWAAIRLLETTRRCPVCKKDFYDYVPNPAIQQLSAEILLQSRDESAHRSILEPRSVYPEIGQGQLSIPPSGQFLSRVRCKPTVVDIPFPGRSARFELQGPGWETIRLGYRKMTFVSKAPDSFFREFGIYGNQDGTIEMFVRWNRNKENDYFSQFCFVQDLYESSSRLYPLDTVEILDPSDQKKMFRIWASNNEVPEPHRSLAGRLIEAGNWKQVTPLTIER